MNTRLKREKPSSRSFKKKVWRNVQTSKLKYVHIRTRRWLSNPMLRRFRVTVTHMSVFQSHSLEFFIGQEFTNDFLETLRWSMHFKKIERTRNTKGKKNIGLSEMHNIFVAADEEKRKTFMKKQINNSKRKKNENSKKTG